MIEIRTSGPLKTTVKTPPSKSYTNRALLVSALAEGESVIENPLFSDDTHFMCQALKDFGVSAEKEENSFRIKRTESQLGAPQNEIYVGNAGTTMRFLTTFACLAKGESRLTGDERMRERPIGDLLACLQSLGVNAKADLGNQCPPLTIQGGNVRGGEAGLAGNKSSQYLTSILQCAPYFDNDTRINIVGELTSKSYIDITLEVMSAFGVSVENNDYRQFFVKAGQKYKPRNYRVEGDASSASYFIAAAAVSGGEVIVTGLNPNSVQGDIKFADVMIQMGCSVEKKSDSVVVRGGHLKGITVDMNNMPDTAQTLAVVALFAEGETVITGIGNLKIKETDRIAALAAELTRLGAEVKAGSDFLLIKPGEYRSAEIETYNDHRMAMSFALAGLKIPGVKIKNPQCVGKSFPDFFDRFQEMYE